MKKEKSNAATAVAASPKKKRGFIANVIRYRVLILMCLPAIVFFFAFNYMPLPGIYVAFVRYNMRKGIFGSPFVGLENFQFLIQSGQLLQLTKNTILYNLAFILLGNLLAVFVAILLNEIRLKFFKRTFQTIVYLPHFLSWVVLATVVTNMFSLGGPFNAVISFFGGEPVQFLADNRWFRTVIIGTDVWKEFGYNSVVYLAALTSIDGAGRFKQTMHITIPALLPTVVLMTALNLGNILNAGFDQIFNLYNPIVYETADIIDTYVYRIGMVERQYSIGTAVGLLKSVISFILIIGANKAAKKITGSGIF